jgi:hypothetical protein
MYSLIKDQGIKKLMTTEIPALAGALILAEAFYHFGSFILECGAFMVSWYIISFTIFKLKPSKKKPVIKMSDFQV